MATRWRWNLKEFEDIRRRQAMVARLGRETEQLRSACGPGYTASVMQGRTRARGNVAAYTNQARADNARNQTLLRALGGSA